MAQCELSSCRRGWSGGRALDPLPGDAVTRLAFSTLACPGWSLEEAVDAAVKVGYAGLELRLLDGALLPADLDANHPRRVPRVMTHSASPPAPLDPSTRLP